MEFAVSNLFQYVNMALYGCGENFDVSMDVHLHMLCNLYATKIDNSLRRCRVWSKIYMPIRSVLFSVSKM